MMANNYEQRQQHVAAFQLSQEGSSQEYCRYHHVHQDKPEDTCIYSKRNPINGLSGFSQSHSWKPIRSCYQNHLIIPSYQILII